MKEKINKISAFIKIDKLKDDKQVVVFLVCLFIATALWFLNALSKDYSTTISYPVKYVGAPPNQFLANEPPTKLELKVDAHGFTLLRHKLNLSFSPIVLNLSNITRDVEPIGGFYTISTNSLLRRISSQVSNEITISEVQPEIIRIFLDSLKTKSVPVKADIELDFKPQFNLKNPVSVVPENIRITGPATIIDTLNFLKTEYKLYDKLDGAIERSVSVEHPENVTLSPEKVVVKIDVEKFTEKELKVPVRIKNKPENVNVKLFPSEIKLSFLVGLSDFEDITAADFNVAVDYNSITPESRNMEVSIESKPSFIQLLRFAPETVEYLIETN